jgi:hypothetical protein
MSYYETTFEHQRLPLGTEFTEEAIEFMEKNDEFVQYYHNYFKEGRHFQSFREMVNERIRLGEIVQNKGSYNFTSIIHFNFYCGIFCLFFNTDNFCSSGRVPVNNHQKDIRNKNGFSVNNTPTNSTMVTTHVTGASYSNQSNSEITSEHLAGNRL